MAIPRGVAQDGKNGSTTAKSSESGRTASALPPWPALQVPTTRSVEELTRFVAEVKLLQPTTPERYLQMQKAIQAASKQLLLLVTDRSSDVFKAAEFDYISSSVMLLGNEGPEAQKKTVNSFREYIQAKSKPNDNDLRMILLAGQNMEQLEDTSIAREAYRSFADLLKSKKDPSLAVWIEMLEANARRVELPGKEMEVRGTTITGEAFDIKSCRGKYTLVYFWASWDKSASEEYPYMQKVYKEYRDKGFEIVGISVDEDREKLERFIREKEVPWIQLWDEKNKSTPVAVQQYGISAIPTLILLDREGKVLSLEARGLILGKLLSKHIDQLEPSAKKP